MRVERLPAGELHRMREIDRSETVRVLYVYEQGELRRVEASLELPAWTEADLARIMQRLAPKLAAGGVLLGAFDGERLTGAAVLGGEPVGVPPTQLEVAFLYVSSPDRGRGVGRLLLDELCRRGQERGAAALYVSASDTESAIRFYLGYGWRPVEHVNPRLCAENEPTDIHLTLDL